MYLVNVGVRDDDALARAKGPLERPEVFGADLTEEVEERLVKALVGDEPKRAVVAEQLHDALFGAQQSDGGRENLLEPGLRIRQVPEAGTRLV